MSAMAKVQKKKAEAYVTEAEKLLGKKSWFSSSKERNQEEAAETLLQAANAYKVGGMNQEAGGVYTRVGDIYQNQLKNANEAAKAYTQAGAFYVVFVCLCPNNFDMTRSLTRFQNMSQPTTTLLLQLLVLKSPIQPTLYKRTNRQFPS